VILSSLFFRRLGKTPAALGDAMIFIGLFYILGALLMPAYMKTKQLEITPGNFDLAGTVVPLIALLFIIAIGFAIGRAEER
jgi:predicted transporter